MSSRVVCTPKGPYLVYGCPVTNASDDVVGIPGEGVALALCACGQSKTKPFCDGSHKAHRAADETPTPDTDPGSDNSA